MQGRPDSRRLFFVSSLHTTYAFASARFFTSFRMTISVSGLSAQAKKSAVNLGLTICKPNAVENMNAVNYNIKLKKVINVKTRKFNR